MPVPDLRGTTGPTAALCRSLAVDYRTSTGTVPALRDIDLTLERGRLTVIAGPSGSGKSSLLRVLAGLQAARAGSVLVGDDDLARMRSARRRRLRRSTMGIVLQNPSDNLVEYLRADEQVQLRPGCGAWTPPSRPSSWTRWGSPTEPPRTPPSCPVASSNASPSRRPPSVGRSCCWPTSPPRSTTPPRDGCS